MEEGGDEALALPLPGVRGRRRAVPVASALRRNGGRLRRQQRRRRDRPTAPAPWSPNGSGCVSVSSRAIERSTSGPSSATTPAASTPRAMGLATDVPPPVRTVSSQLQAPRCTSERKHAVSPTWSSGRCTADTTRTVAGTRTTTPGVKRADAMVRDVDARERADVKLGRRRSDLHRAADLAFGDDASPALQRVSGLTERKRGQSRGGDEPPHHAADRSSVRPRALIRERAATLVIDVPAQVSSGSGRSSTP